MFERSQGSLPCSQGQLLCPILRQLNAVHHLAPYLFKVYFNNMIPCDFSFFVLRHIACIGPICCMPFLNVK